MKKTWQVAAALIFLIACKDKYNETETTVTDSGAVILPTNTDSQPADHTKVTKLYAPAEGDIIYRNNRISTWKNNAYVDAETDVTLDNGIVVNKNGEVTREDKTIKLEEGESVNKVGDFFNKAGDKIEDAWTDTKRAVKKAAKAVEKAADTAAKKIKKAVD